MTNGFTCTSCHRPTEHEPDITGMPVETIILLCEHWKCDDCLKIHEDEEAAYAARTATGGDHG